MRIAALPNQDKYAVVRIHGDIVGVYSEQHQAVSHARYDKTRKSVTTCRWESADKVKADLKTFADSLKTVHIVDRTVKKIVADWLNGGWSNYAILNKDGSVKC